VWGSVQACRIIAEVAAAEGARIISGSWAPTGSWFTVGIQQSRFAESDSYELLWRVYGYRERFGSLSAWAGVGTLDPSEGLYFDLAASGGFELDVHAGASSVFVRQELGISSEGVTALLMMGFRFLPRRVAFSKRK
jgi:hypothetical protein